MKVGLKLFFLFFVFKVSRMSGIVTEPNLFMVGCSLVKGTEQEGCVPREGLQFHFLSLDRQLSCRRTLPSRAPGLRCV